MVQTEKETPMNLPDGWDAEELARAERLAARVHVGADAQIFAARAPGRVNLIGEHTDYSGLPVLPVAIDRTTIVIAAGNATGEVELANADPAWPSRRFEVERHIPPYETGDWANYLKAAIQGVLDQFSARTNWRGASMVVGSTVPSAAGLSSSSALTVATAMAFMAVNELELDPLETAAMVARSERYVGTHGGGMDQAVSILGRRDHALFIEFEPLRVRAIKMPANAALVVADSRQIADKSGTVRAEYNRRVVECSLAARILGHALKLDGVKNPRRRGSRTAGLERGRPCRNTRGGGAGPARRESERGGEYPRRRAIVARRGAARRGIDSNRAGFKPPAGDSETRATRFERDQSRDSRSATCSKRVISTRWER